LLPLTLPAAEEGERKERLVSIFLICYERDTFHGCLAARQQVVKYVNDNNDNNNNNNDNNKRKK
jgi:hypothetical protein